MAFLRRFLPDAGRRPATVIVLVGALVLIGLGAKVGVRRPNSSGDLSSPPQQQSRLVPTGPAEMVYFTVYDAGIFPREAHVSAGAVVVHIEDMSGTSAGLLVTNDSLQTVAQVGRRHQHWRDQARISLAAGRYTIYDASRPMNRSTLIVEP